MKLFGTFTSPFVRHCRIAVIETGLDVEFVETRPAPGERQSKTMKVPFFEDGDLTLTDSSTILRYLRETAGATFLPDLLDFELYCTANTALDTGINLLLFERLDQLTAQQSKYLARQEARLTSALGAFEEGPLPNTLPLSDGPMRLACFLAWGLFRNRFDLEGRPRLGAFLSLAGTDAAFAATSPPAGA